MAEAQTYTHGAAKKTSAEGGEDDEEEYAVDIIIRRRVGADNVMRYRVLWENGEKTWEPYKNLTHCWKMEEYLENGDLSDSSDSGGHVDDDEDDDEADGATGLGADEDHFAEEVTHDKDPELVGVKLRKNQNVLLPRRCFGAEGMEDGLTLAKILELPGNREDGLVQVQQKIGDVTALVSPVLVKKGVVAKRKDDEAMKKFKQEAEELAARKAAAAKAADAAAKADKAAKVARPAKAPKAARPAAEASAEQVAAAGLASMSAGGGTPAASINLDSDVEDVAKPPEPAAKPFNKKSSKAAGQQVRIRLIAHSSVYRLLDSAADPARRAALHHLTPRLAVSAGAGRRRAQGAYRGGRALQRRRRWPQLRQVAKDDAPQRPGALAPPHDLRCACMLSVPRAARRTAPRVLACTSF